MSWKLNSRVVMCYNSRGEHVRPSVVVLDNAVCWAIIEHSNGSCVKNVLAAVECTLLQHADC
jgi:hypothetical protein